MFDAERVKKLLLMGVGRQTSPAGATILSDLKAEIDEAVKKPENFAGVRAALLAVLEWVTASATAQAPDFCALLETSSFPLNAIADELRDCVDRRLKTRDTLASRGELLRLLSRTLRAYGPDLLKCECDLKAEYPWVWIDCMSRVDIERAADEIANLLLLGGASKVGRSVQMLLWRLPRLARSLEGRTSKWARVWIDSIRDPDSRDQLAQWFALREYDVALSHKRANGIRPHIVERDIPDPGRTFLISSRSASRPIAAFNADLIRTQDRHSALEVTHA